MIDIMIQKPLFGSHGEIVLDIDLHLKQKDFIALTGKSGSGKTTFLRILAGLEEAHGSIMIDDEVWLSGKRSLKVQEREIGFVFQEYALFPNMSVEDNLLYVRDDKKLATHLLELVELEPLRKKLPAQLSGGQKQRVSLARAMMGRPKLLLLDEPFSALDRTMRLKLQEELLTLHKEFGTTTIMVSHDKAEIYRLADRVLILDQGKIISDTVVKEALLEESFSCEVLSVDERGVSIMINDKILIVPYGERKREDFQVGQQVMFFAKELSLNPLNYDV